MANLNGPLFGFDAEGSLGKEVTYSKWKGGTYAKVWRAPKDPKSTSQVLSRDTWRVGNSIWKAGSELFVEPWNRSAQGKVKSGYNAWIGRYLTSNLGQPNFVELVIAPKVIGGIPPIAVGLIPGSGSITVVFNIPTPPTGWTPQAVIGGAIINQNPATATNVGIAIVQGAIPPGFVVLTPLAPSTLYVATGWLRWLLPGGQVAWSQSLPMAGVTTLA